MVNMARSVERRRRATIFDVAAEANVSRGTVSRVLNGEPYVSAAAREAIEKAIAKVGYVRNMAARNLVTQRTKAIALIVHEPHSVFLEDPNIGAILLGTNDRLSEAEYQLVCLVIGSERDSARVAGYLRGGFVDGAIIVSAREQDPIALAISEIGLPAVFIGHPGGQPDLTWVGIDNRSAASEVTTRLLATGRKRVGMIAAALDRDSGADRLAGFRAALGDRFDSNLVVEVALYSRASGVEGMRELMKRDPHVDGVFASSDSIAAGAMDVLRDLGKRVPEELGIAGFDDSDWAMRCDPLLSTVRQPADLLGREAATIVLDLLDGVPAAAAGTLLPTQIVWRDSA